MTSELSLLKTLAPHTNTATNLEQIALPLTKGNNATPDEVKNAASQFEGLLLQEMFKSMWATVPQNGFFGSGREEEYYRDMLNQALAESISEHQSIGIRDVIAKDINKLQNKGEKK